MLEVSIKKKLRDYEMDVSFNADMKTMGILGASGCAKSMTLKCIAGIETPDSGRIVLDGRVLFDKSRKINLKPQDRKIGYLFQNYALFPNMTVLGNIRAAIRKDRRSGNSGILPDAERQSVADGRGNLSAGERQHDTAEGRLPVNGEGRSVEERISRLVSLFRLEGLENEYPRRLSGGQQQRTALARIFASEPELLLLDEPFSAMDAYLREELQLLMKDTIAREFKGSCIMVTHDRDEAYRLCDSLMIMDNGRIAEQGETKALFANPATYTGARVTGCKNISRIKPLGNGIVEAIDFGIKLYLGESSHENTGAIGIRAHDFREAGEDCVNAIEVENAEVIASPFEDTVIFSPKGSSARLWWKRKNKGQAVPEKIYIDPSQIMRLRV